ncbi:hypothetical protein [Gordonia shandongensis]|uniref:hypothetical protein n=1 Tax=Gordonia shandongensis TaxID=376351 RepID=UPI00041DFC3E|nr:hypothetical protein [Gordonia shandongensis]
MTPSLLRRFRRVATTCLSLGLPVGMVVVAAPATAAPSTVTVTVDASSPGYAIPPDFLGLSFEAAQMHRTWADPDRGNVTSLIRGLGDGNLRFSANQVDNTAWVPDPRRPTPSWATNGQRVEPADLSRVGRLAEATGWSVDLGVNLGHFDPKAAANQVASAVKRIGSHLRSVQIGNEPNAFVLNVADGSRKLYTPQTYVADVAKYRSAIRAAAPGVRIEGPDAAAGSIGVPPADGPTWSTIVEPWLGEYIRAFGAQSRHLNQHYYPYVNVTRVGAPAGVADAAGALPTVDRLLTEETAGKQQTFMRDFAAMAHRAGLEPRLTEANSVAKEGREGVTNSFGAALWTVDFLMSAARAGITGVDLHNQVDDCESYPLFCFPDAAARASDMARVNPNYYAALMVSEMVGGTVLPTEISSKAHVAAHAVRTPSGAIKVIVDNMDRTFRGTVVVKIVGANTSSGSVQKLTGPSIYALSGTRFSGSTVTRAGTFTAQSGAPLARGATGFRLAMNRPGAALLTLR